MWYQLKLHPFFCNVHENELEGQRKQLQATRLDPTGAKENGYSNYSSAFQFF